MDEQQTDDEERTDPMGETLARFAEERRAADRQPELLWSLTCGTAR